MNEAETIAAAVAPKKGVKRTKPTQRTRQHCQALGYTSAIVEKFVRFPPPGHLVDLFGFIDLVALASGVTIGIQTCAGGDVAKRRAKIEASEHLEAVLAAHWWVEVWSWSKRGARGKRKLWTLKRERLVGPGNWQEIPNTNELEEEGLFT